FAVKRWAEEQEASLEVIGEDSELSWNDKILAAIDEHTALVLISSVHWMNGYIFDLEAIGAKCQKVGACFIVDGTQSVGAKPIDVKACKIDALICATYKWLLGPYSLGLAYFGEKFEGGKPLEESWMNRTNSRNFSDLTNYRQEFLPKAHRFDVGESSHFILMPILKKSLEQILQWSTDEIQHYTSDLKKYLFEILELDLFHSQSSSNHLFALPLKSGLNPQALKSDLENEKVFVSVRGQSLRVSLHLYNDQNDIKRLVSVLEKS
ncbi:MAG TPA: aminotransferase, partial [Algoriphagus sp.]|nr:aminotransferase [Algoriphagus sp.]